MFGFEKKEYNKKDYDEAESKYSEATEKLKRCLFNSESLEEAKEKLSREYQWYTQDVKDYINELCRDLAESERKLKKLHDLGHKEADDLNKEYDWLLANFKNSKEGIDSTEALEKLLTFEMEKLGKVYETEENKTPLDDK